MALCMYKCSMSIKRGICIISFCMGKCSFCCCLSFTFLRVIVIVVVVIVMGTLNAICCIANDTENYRDIYLRVELVSTVESCG